MSSILLDANSKLDDIFKSNDTTSAHNNQLLSNRTLEPNATLESHLAAFESHQYLEKDDKSEQLLFANLNILGLIETNELLKRQYEDCEFKLNAVINKSATVIEAYENDLTAKTELIDLYKENDEASSHEYQEHVNELESGMKMLQQFLRNTVDMCETLESELNASKEKHQQELDAKDKIITMLKKELMHNTDLPKAVENENENNQKDIEHDDEVLKHVSVPDKDNRCSKRRVTLTDFHTQCRIIKKDILDQKREYAELEIQLKNLFEKMKVLFKHTGSKVDEDSHQLLADLITKIQEIKISECNHLDVNESRTNENEFLLDTVNQPIVMLKKIFWKNGETLQNVNGRGLYECGYSSMLTSSNYRMKLRPKKRARTDGMNERITGETITLSEDEKSDDEVSSGKENGSEISSDEIIVCVDDDEDCVLVTGPTQAEFLRESMVNFKRSSRVNRRSIRVRALHGSLRTTSFDN